jgi:hypothetical protein
MADDAKTRLAKVQAARDKLEESRGAEIAAAEKTHFDACREAGKASPEAANQRNKTCKEIDERYQLSRRTLDRELADAKAAVGHFVMKNDGTPARGGVIVPVDGKDKG